MKKIKIINKAFSLIELSIVILIIGILVAGVTQSSRLIKRMNIQTAQNLTQNSPVSSISGLVVWFETISQNSFNESEKQDQGNITIWYDLNPFTTSKVNPTAPGVNNQPKYIENAFNSLPGIRFDGIDDYLRSDNISIAGSQVTYFIVSKRKSYIIYASPFSTLAPGGLYDNNTDYNFRAFLELDTTMYPFRNGWGALTTHPGNNVTFISCGIYNGSTNISYVNGVASTPGASTGNFNISTIFLAATWQNGIFGNGWNGDIAEIIIFSRALKNDERQDIEKYLSKKWSIKIS